MKERKGRIVQYTMSMRVISGKPSPGVLQEHILDFVMTKWLKSTRTSSRASSHDFGRRKLRILIFRGDDAYGWIVRAKRDFKLNLLEDDEKLDVVVIALEDKALSWH